MLQSPTMKEMTTIEHYDAPSLEEEDSSLQSNTSIPSPLFLADRITLKRQLEHPNFNPAQLVELFHNRSVFLHTFVRYTQHAIQSNPQRIFDIASHITSEEEMRQVVGEFLRMQPESLTRDTVISSVLGISNTELARQYKVEPNTIAKKISTYRITSLEPNFLYPIGLQRTNVGGKTLVKAASQRYDVLETFGIANIRYVSAKQLADYDKRKRVVDPQLIKAGYILLNEFASDSEIRIISGSPRYAEMVLKRFNRVYIKPADLRMFREQRGKGTHTPNKKDTGRYTAMTRQEYKRLHYAQQKLVMLNEGEEVDLPSQS